MALPESGERAASLQLSPAEPEPDDRVEIAVANESEELIGYGLGYCVYRAVDGGWRDVTGSDELLSQPVPLVPLPEILVKPGDASGRRESGHRDGFAISAQAEPGDDRVVKEIKSYAPNDRGLLKKSGRSTAYVEFTIQP